MSKALSKLLGQPDHLVASFINHLERLSGAATEDIRLLNETSHKIMDKNISLGLDPTDTNGQELYYAAQARFAANCANFEKVISADKNVALAKKLSRLAKLAGYSGACKEVWVLKHSVAKDLLRVHPPKALMRQLHYRSIESMLKHENVVGLFGALSFTTSARWQHVFHKAQAKLSPLDFELRELEIVSLAAKRWQGVLPNSISINSVAELGAVIILPTKAAEQADSLAMLALILQAAEKIRIISIIAKAQQGRGAFGEAVSKIWQGDLPHLASLGGHSLSWQSFLNHLGHQPETVHPVELEPYIYPQDLHWQDVNEQMSKLHPSLAWWRDSAHLLHAVGRGVSLNAADVSLNHIRGAEYKQRSLSGGRQAFWDELISRYLSHPMIFDRVAAQLDQSLTPSAIRVVSEEVDMPNLKTQAQIA